MSDRESLLVEGFPPGFESAYLAPTKFLYFEQVPNPGRKTSIWKVVARSSGDTLGHISWYGPWRQYVFHPATDTLYNVDRGVAVFDRVATCNRWQRNIRANPATAKAAS